MFLDVVTRAFRRPEMLKRNWAGLSAQTDPDWTQARIVDSAGIGVVAANAKLYSVTPFLDAQYVWVLDDDDECIRPSLVAELKVIAQRFDPDVIMLKMNHGPLGILPDADHWRNKPERGHVGMSAFVVKLEVWRKYAHIFAQGVLTADFNFIEAVLLDTPPDRVYWHNVVASKVQRISRGAPE